VEVTISKMFLLLVIEFLTLKLDIQFLEVREINQTYLAYSDLDSNKFFIEDFEMNEIARLQPAGVQTIQGKIFFENFL